MDCHAPPPQLALPLSVVIITYNAAALLPDCLASVAWAAEILVVDSGSTDQTVALASAAGARVLFRAWPGFGAQKQFAVEQARYDWVLCIDADERVTPELAQSIRVWLQAEFAVERSVARCARRNRFLGRYLRHGEGYPDWNVRFFHRAYARWANLPVHEHVLTEQVIGTLVGDLLHHSQESLGAYLDKQNGYTSMQAEMLCTQAKPLPTSRLILKLLLAAPVRFVRFYIFRLGFLDGLAGFVHIAIGSFFAFIKYAKVLARSRQP